MSTIGCFVIHGNNVGTLEACIESLVRVSDVPVIAVDSNSDDGSRDLAGSLGAKSITQPWQGYGAARAAAVQALDPCDYVFFLDSDEYLTEQNIDALVRWKENINRGPVYRVSRKNWVSTAQRRFVLFTDHRARLVKREKALWLPDMIVHEALPPGPHSSLRIEIEHHYSDASAQRLAKNDMYALLWAIQAQPRGKKVKSPMLEQLVHFIKRGLLSGALFRGGSDAIRFSWLAAAYHARKYRYLERVKRGEFDDLLRLYSEMDLKRLFQLRRAPHRGARRLVEVAEVNHRPAPV